MPKEKKQRLEEYQKIINKNSFDSVCCDLS